MAYSAFETAANECLRHVESLVPHLTASGTFDTTTVPTLAQVERWLTIEYNILQGKLADIGYESVPTDSQAIAILQEAQALAVAVRCEMANPVMARTGEPSERFQELKRQRDDVRAFLASDALEHLGASRERALGAFVEATGVSRSRKSSVETDTDWIHHRFKRGQFRRKDTSMITSATDTYDVDQ